MDDRYKEVKEAEIILNGNKIEIFGKERKEVLEYTRYIDEEETKKLIKRLEEKLWIIDSKIDRRGYFFNDDIGIISYQPEVIVYLLNNVFQKSLNFGKEYGVGGRAIYFDEDYQRWAGRNVRDIAQGLYNEHYGVNE